MFQKTLFLKKKGSITFGVGTLIAMRCATKSRLPRLPCVHIFFDPVTINKTLFYWEPLVKTMQ